MLWLQLGASLGFCLATCCAAQQAPTRRRNDPSGDAGGNRPARDAWLKDLLKYDFENRIWDMSVADNSVDDDAGRKKQVVGTQDGRPTVDFRKKVGRAGFLPMEYAQKVNDYYIDTQWAYGSKTEIPTSFDGSGPNNRIPDVIKQVQLEETQQTHFNDIAAINTIDNKHMAAHPNSLGPYPANPNGHLNQHMTNEIGHNAYPNKEIPALITQKSHAPQYISSTNMGHGTYVNEHHGHAQHNIAPGHPNSVQASPGSRPHNAKSDQNQPHFYPDQQGHPSTQHNSYLNPDLSYSEQHDSYSDNHISQNEQQMQVPAPPGPDFDQHDPYGQINSQQNQHEPLPGHTIPHPTPPDSPQALPGPHWDRLSPHPAAHGPAADKLSAGGRPLMPLLVLGGALLAGSLAGVAYLLYLTPPTLVTYSKRQRSGGGADLLAPPFELRRLTELLAELSQALAEAELVALRLHTAGRPARWRRCQPLQLCRALLEGARLRLEPVWRRYIRAAPWLWMFGMDDGTARRLQELAQLPGFKSCRQFFKPCDKT